jgi:hypothetical protein
LNRGLWVASGVVLLGAAWLVLTGSGVLGGWAQHLAGHLPPWLVLAGTVSVPVLAALCSLHLQIDWRIRIALLLVLLACVPLLPLSFGNHPCVVTVVVVVFFVEEFVVIPAINRRWVAPRR